MLLYTRNVAFIWLGASDLRGCVQEALCPSLRGCLCVVFSTRGVFCVCRRSSETLERSSFFSCLSVVPLQVRKKERAVLGRRRCRRRSLNSMRWRGGSVWCLLTDSSSSPLLPVKSDGALVNPAPLLTLRRAARVQKLSVMTSLTTSGCVSHVCSPGFLLRRCQWQTQQSFHSLLVIYETFFYFSLFFPRPLSWWMDWILHVL